MNGKQFKQIASQIPDDAEVVISFWDGKAHYYKPNPTLNFTKTLTKTGIAIPLHFDICPAHNATDTVNAAFLKAYENKRMRTISCTRKQFLDNIKPWFDDASPDHSTEDIVMAWIMEGLNEPANDEQGAVYAEVFPLARQHYGLVHEFRREIYNDVADGYFDVYGQDSWRDEIRKVVENHKIRELVSFHSVPDMLLNVDLGDDTKNYWSAICLAAEKRLVESHGIPEKAFEQNGLTFE